MDTDTVVARAQEITGDAMVGTTRLEPREDGDPAIIYRGSRGWYEIHDVDGIDMAILFRVGENWEAAESATEIGIYYTRPLEKDNDAAEFLKQIVDGLPPLTFDCAFIPPSEAGTAWIRFRAEEVPVLIKMKSSGLESMSEFIVGDLIARMVLDADGEMKSFGQVDESIL
jgi:hypothetical protein